MTKKLRRVPKDKKTGVPKKYLSGSKNKSAKAAEIKKTGGPEVLELKDHQSFIKKVLILI